MSTVPVSENMDPWEHLRYFLGEWKGEGTGKPGVSKSDRKYDLILKDSFIRVENRSVYPAQEKNPDGEIHEDLGFFSFDKNREMYVFREFHVEGYVNQYVIEEWDKEEGVIVLSSEAIENISPGWRARTTYEILSDNKFRETFDLSGPGKDWACYITNDFERVAEE